MKIEKLRQDLKKIEIEIEEQEKRIPPHSVKPQLMIDLEKLEDERDRLLNEIKQAELD